MGLGNRTEYDAACAKLTALNASLVELTAVPAGGDSTVWTDEEQARAQTLHDECAALESDIEDYEGKQKAAEQIGLAATARQKQLDTVSRPRQTQPTAIVASDVRMGSDGASLLPTELVSVRRNGRLRSFTGATAEYDAYASGQWLLSQFGPPESRANASTWCREHLAQSEISNVKGGALVPEQFERAIIDLREVYGVARRECKIRPMTTDSMVIPRRVSGPTAYFLNDNKEITASDKSWDQVTLTAQKIGCLTKFSSELAEDAIISIADDLADEFAHAFSKLEDQCVFIGDGTSTYGGISGLITECATATATIVTATTTHIAYSDMTLSDFESMVGLLPSYAEAGAKWFISMPAFAASMMRLADAAGGNTADMIAGQRSLMFLGYPVVITPVMNTTLTDQASTAGLCYFGNLALASSLGDRRGIRTIASAERYMELDQIGIQGTERVAINVHDVGDTSVAGAMIMLKSPTS